MEQNIITTEVQNLLNTHRTAEELAESLDRILFTATVSYLDSTNGGTTEDIVNDVYNIRFLLETLRRCSATESFLHFSLQIKIM